jgi:hypothetical protein
MQSAMAAALARHDQLFEQRVAECGGHIVRPRGLVRFSRPRWVPDSQRPLSKGVP